MNRAIIVILAAPFLLIQSFGTAFADCDVFHVVENSTSNVLDLGQSYTAECSGVLDSITIKTQGGVNNVRLRIYNGAGFGGVLLGTLNGENLSVGQHIISIPSLLNINIISGNIYTLRLDAAGVINLRFDSLNGYPAGPGQAYNNGIAVPGSDFWFNVQVVDTSGGFIQISSDEFFVSAGCFISASEESRRH